MAEETEQMSAAVDEQLAQCGARLKSLRVARGWTLDELAERTGLSKAFLSRLEAGDRRPSIAAVLTLARAFEVALGALFDEKAMPTESCVIVRGESAATRQGDGLSYVSLSSTARFTNLQPMRLTVSFKRKGDERYQHEGEEWVYVIKGKLRLSVGSDVYELLSGDAAHFDSRVPHRLTALNGQDAELIVVACPLPDNSLPTIEARPRFRARRAIR